MKSQLMSRQRHLVDKLFIQLLFCSIKGRLFNSKGNINSEFKKLNIISTQMSHINHKYMDYFSKYVREYLTCVHT